jgi:hypothetical protein
MSINLTNETLAERFEYLDRLRESGVTNMFGAAPYVASHFDTPADEAGTVLTLWMNTFSDEAPAERAAKALEE